MHWDYENINSDNWNDESLEWQHDKLIKYYPIGMEIEFINKTDEKTHPYSNSKHITNHICKKTIWNVESEGDISMHPGYFRPTIKWLRTTKLERILNGFE